MFNIYEKSSGRYLGHGTITAMANLSGARETLELVPQQNSALEEEYFELKEEVEQKYKHHLDIERDSYRSYQKDQSLPDDDDITVEEGGVLSMPMSKFPKFQDATVSHFQLENFARFRKKTMENMTEAQEMGESRPEEKND